MKKEKKLAIKLRTAGLSYNEIQKKLHIPKGTLSYWFKHLKFSETIKNDNTRKAKTIWAKNITLYNQQRSLLSIIKSTRDQRESEKDIAHISKKELKLIGTALYWAEGYKKGRWNVIFSNSDPNMHKIMIKFFTGICNISTDKIRAQVQIHKNIKPTQAIDYWSKIIGLPKKNFMNPIYQVSKSSKQKRGNTLPYGTLRLRINDVKLVNRIKGWLNGLIKNY